MMRLIFMGTPEFAVPVLDTLFARGYEIVAAVSQPDREKDKKGNLLETPVKNYALSHGILCLQYDKISQHVAELRELKPDIMITAAYGQLLSDEVLGVPPLGILNVHASLLPKYRGSSPVQSAILCGETETGVTIMKTESGMDTGDIVSVKKVKIEETDTADSLSGKLSEAGAKLLSETLPDYAAGKIALKKQNSDLATYCKKITKSDGIINWNLSAREIACKIRAYNSWPVATSYLHGVAFKIYEARECEICGTPGAVTVKNGEMIVACGAGSIKPTVVQLPGKRAMNIAEFLRGHKLEEGTVLKNA